MTREMRAVRIHRHGGPEVLRLETIPIPTPAPNEVLIRVAASAINPADWKIRQGTLPVRIPLPRVLGADVAGTIESVGALVTQWKVGEAVVARVDGAYAEYVAAKADVVARAPRTVPLHHAAAIPVAGCTAWSVLFDTIALRAGQTVLVHGGAGSVGGLAVQLAKNAGARVITTATGTGVALATAFGADEVIDYAVEDFSKRVSGADAVLDTIGGDTQARSWTVLRAGGALASIVAPPDPATAEQHGVTGLFGRREANTGMLEALVGLVDAGRLRIVIERELPLDEVRAAHEASEAGHARGKILLRVG